MRALGREELPLQRFFKKIGRVKNMMLSYRRRPEVRFFLCHLLSLFSLLETNNLKIYERPLSWHAKFSGFRWCLKNVARSSSPIGSPPMSLSDLTLEKVLRGRCVNVCLSIYCLFLSWLPNNPGILSTNSVCTLVTRGIWWMPSRSSLLWWLQY